MNNKIKIISGALVIVVCTLIGVLRLKDNPQKEEVSVEPTQYMQEMSVDLKAGREELGDEGSGLALESNLNAAQEKAQSALEGNGQDASQGAAQNMSQGPTQGTLKDTSPGPMQGTSKGALQGTAQNEPQKVVVHVCGCVEKPGVYTLTEDDRIVDAVNKAGGFTEEAAADYLNLANPLVDGCKIYVPSKDEVAVNMSPKDTMGADGTTEAAASTSIPSKNAVSVSVPSKDAVSASVPSKDAVSAVSANRDYIELPVLSETKQEMTADTEDTGNALVNLNTASKEELMTLPGVGESKALKIITYREENGGFNAIEDIMNITGIKEKMFDKIKDHITV